MAKRGKEFWQKEVAALAASGQSVEKFSEGKSYCSNSLYRWRQKLSASQPFVKAIVKPPVFTAHGLPPSLPEPEWVARFVCELVRRQA